MIPDGKIVKGWTVQLDPLPTQAARFRRDCGARRFACNWAVAQIMAAFEHGRQTGEHDSAVWSAWSLRKRWNQVKDQATAVTDPDTGEVRGSWWAECSKEAYACGIADAVTALKNWQDSRTGRLAGPRAFRRHSATRQGGMGAICGSRTAGTRHPRPAPPAVW